MKTCKHASCGDVCKYPAKVKKRYRIKPYSKKRAKLNTVYDAEARRFREENPDCAINSPNCTGRTQGVHHPKGRGKYLLAKEIWKPACNPCNDYCEDHTQWAIDNGHKESRLTQ